MEPPSKLRGRATWWQATAAVGVAPMCIGFSLGCGYGNLAGVLVSDPFKDRYHDPSDATLQLLAGCMQIGCVLGSIIAAWIADAFGRRPSILAAVFVIIISGLVVGIPSVMAGSSLAPLLVGRVLLGIGGGIASAVVPMHISETAMPEVRGGVAVCFQLAMELGILVAYFISWLTYARAWLLSLTLPLFSASVFFVWAVFFLVESPRYHVLRAARRARIHESGTRSEVGGGETIDEDELRKAETLMCKLRTPSHEVRKELAACVEEVTRGDGGQWRDLCSPSQQRVVAVACVTLSLQVATGIDILTVYAPKIFKEISPSSGDPDSDESLRRELMYTLLIGLTFCIVTPFAIGLVERVGRRALLLAGGSGMCGCLVGLAVCLQLLQGANGTAHATLGVVCLVFVFGFVACFSFSWGPVAWIVPSELVPSAIRAKVLAAGTVLNWVADYIVVSTFLSLTNAIGNSGGFMLYAVINFIAVLFVYRYVPETRGLELESISAGNERFADPRLNRLLPR